MTSEQCDEIVRKVWGWENHDKEHFYSPSGEPVWYPDKARIEKMVNSWQGFGRTVEAMANGDENGFWTLDINMNMVTFIAHRSPQPITDPIEKCWCSAGINEIPTLWEATHLAALEALK